jgi:hypothetical protein
MNAVQFALFKVVGAVMTVVVTASVCDSMTDAPKRQLHDVPAHRQSVTDQTGSAIAGGLASSL